MNEELENGLHKEIESYVNERLRPISAELSRLQGEHHEALGRLRQSAGDVTLSGTALETTIKERLEAAHKRGAEEAAAAAEADYERRAEEAAAAAEAAHNRGAEEAAAAAEAARKRGAEEAAAAAEAAYKRGASETAASGRAKISRDFAVVRKAVEEIQEQKSQADVLNALLNSGAKFAGRVALFVIKNEQALAWRVRSDAETLPDSEVSQIALPLTADTVISHVVRSRSSWSGLPGANAEDNLLHEPLKGDPKHIAAVPFVVRGKAVAVLYADSSSPEADAVNLDALEALVRVAAMAVELVTATRWAARQASAARPAPQPAPEAEPQPAPVTAVPTVPEVSPPPAETPVAAPVARSTPAAQPPAPVVSTAPSFVSQQGAPLGTARRYGAAEPELPIEVGEDERRLHNDARRFARLLVSEIKLYNEQKLQEGRSKGDIYDRLREDIERSRRMYEKRVASPVAERYDYFHQELVNTLAEGDSSKLGKSYPGASVASN